MKGVSTKRRDRAVISKTTGEAILKAVLTGERDRDRASVLLFQVVVDIASARVEDFAITKAIRDENVKGEHMACMKRMKILHTNRIRDLSGEPITPPRVGDRLSFVVVTKAAMRKWKFHGADSQVMSRTLPIECCTVQDIDMHYYIEKQIAPLVRFVTVLQDKSFDTAKAKYVEMANALVNRATLGDKLTAELQSERFVRYIKQAEQGVVERPGTGTKKQQTDIQSFFTKA